MIEVEGPDGAILEFPPDTPREVMKAAMQKRYASAATDKLREGMGSPQAADQQQLAQDTAAEVRPGAEYSARDQIQAFAGNALDGIPIVGPAIRSGVEHARAGVDSLINGTSFADELAEAQGSAKANTENYPITALAGSVTGGAVGTAPLLAAAPLAMGVRGASLAGRAIAAGTSGAGLSATDAAVRSGGDLNETLKGAAVGAGLGAAGPLAAKAVGSTAQALVNRRTDKAAAKAASGAASSQQLKEQSGAFYDQARAAGVVVKPESYQQFLVGAIRDLKNEGADRTLHPKVIAVTQRLADAASKPISFDELETLRRVVGGAAASIDPDERRVASILKDSLDDWMENLPPGSVSAGDAKAASGMLRNARDLWGQARRGEMLEKIARDAEQSATGYEAGLRNGFRALAKNEKKLRGFSEVEKRAIRAVAQGTPVERVLRLLGKAAPTGIVSGVLSGGAGYAYGGEEGAALALGAGLAGRTAANALVRSSAKKAGNIVRLGREAQKALPKPRQPNQDRINDWASRILLGTAPAINTPRD